MIYPLVCMTSAVLSRAAQQDFYIALISFSEHLSPVWMWNGHADAAESQREFSTFHIPHSTCLRKQVWRQKCLFHLLLSSATFYLIPPFTFHFPSPRGSLSSSRRRGCLGWKLLGAVPAAGKRENRDVDCSCEGGTALPCAAATDSAQHIQSVLTAHHTSHGG